MKSHKIKKGKFFHEFHEMVKRKTAQPTKSTLQDLEPEIEQRYRQYWNNRSEPEQLPPNVDALARSRVETQSLEDAYDPGALIMKRWKAKLFNGKIQRCPYCQIETATHWDHFLPHSLYPDYSVYQPNLIRTCDRCNTRKSANKVYPTREIIHPYFDPLETVKFLHCDVGSTPTVTATFSIQPDTTQNGFSPYLDNIVKEHFEFFDLADVFRGEAAEAIGQLSDALRSRAEVDKLPPSKAFIDTYSDNKIIAAFSEDKNENCWEIAFWRATLRVSSQLANFWTVKFKNEGLIP